MCLKKHKCTNEFTKINLISSWWLIFYDFIFYSCLDEFFFYSKIIIAVIFWWWWWWRRPYGTNPGFMHSFNKYQLSIYYVPATIPSIWTASVKKRRPKLLFGRETDNKHTHTINKYINSISCWKVMHALERESSVQGSRVDGCHIHYANQQYSPHLSQDLKEELTEWTAHAKVPRWESVSGKFEEEQGSQCGCGR